jgi:hypothetical protein
MSDARPGGLPERGLRLGLTAVGAAIVLGCVGCSNGGSSNTDPPTNSSLPSSSSPATSPTPDLLTQAKSDLRKAQATYYATYTAAVANPNDRQAVDRLRSLYQRGSPAERGMSKFMKTFALDGLKAKAGPKGYFVVERVDVSSVAEGAKANVTVCTYHDSVTYDARHNGPDGRPVTVDDTIFSARSSFRYIHLGNSWKFYNGGVIKLWTGKNLCPAKF